MIARVFLWIMISKRKRDKQSALSLFQRENVDSGSSSYVGCGYRPVDVIGK